MMRAKVIRGTFDDSAGEVLNRWLGRHPTFNVIEVKPVVEKHSRGDMGHLHESTHYIVLYEVSDAVKEASK